MLPSLHAKMEELNSIMLSRYIKIKPFVKTVVTRNSKSEKYPFPSRRHGSRVSVTEQFHYTDYSVEVIILQTVAGLLSTTPKL